MMTNIRIVTEIINKSKATVNNHNRDNQSVLLNKDYKSKQHAQNKM